MTTDRRRIDAVTDDEAERGFERDSRCLRECEERLGRWLERIDRSKAYIRSGCASAVDYAVRRGHDRARATEFLRLGRTLQAVEGAEKDVREGRLTPQAAAELGKLFPPASATGAPAPQVDTREWLERAKTVPRRQLRREVRAAVEQTAQGDRVVPISFHVKESVREDFRRAKTVAARKADAVLTDGQALAAITSDYLARHDPLRRERRARRVGPTSERPDDRYVPAEVQAAVLDRSADRCEFPGCGNRVFLQYAHLTWHKDRGDREESNLLRLCTLHHTLQDAGRIRFLGLTPDGVEFLVVTTGEVVSEATIPPDARRSRGDDGPRAPPPAQVSEAAVEYRVRPPGLASRLPSTPVGGGRVRCRRPRRRVRGGSRAPPGQRVASPPAVT